MTNANSLVTSAVGNTGSNVIQVRIYAEQARAANQAAAERVSARADKEEKAA